MKTYAFERLYQDKQCWIAPAYVTVDAAGTITAVGSEAPDDGTPVEHHRGLVLPGFQNAHSHAFQYAMAGLAEFATRPDDDFWSWRTAMYDLALRVGPEQLEAIATMLYAEMVRHGYTAVAEFHYLHHDVDGRPYAEPALLSHCLMRAAARAGIHLTLVPMFYRLGGFDQPATAQQRRFLSPDTDAYLDLLAAVHKTAASFAHVTVGAGVHSLRAASRADIQFLLGEADLRGPLHLHIAEQTGEVAACEARWGQRPVAWLLDHVAVDARFHLVHATHVTEAEWRGMVKAGANAVICPSTEGNLGDGFFPIDDYHAAGGAWCIGTDSHVGLSPLEELRWLDYGRRLQRRRRNVMCPDVGADGGVEMVDRAFHGGRAAMGAAAQKGYFAVGTPFDAVLVDSDHPLLAVCEPDRLIATLIYAGDVTFIRTLFQAGTVRVENGRHREADAIRAAFSSALRALNSRGN
ncbi:formimidoylglutamate deiminase [Acanthopleuribacter pedis]|uniref:Formimidoylglutamate deiminase n=1 Tax=Acanthopleuribacter pedis TaxID=442870 RepID=A0A8J7Q9C7_9BACT|nr:formimidoylglutamate deiminase [Acanthopleuribacter pedis]MBO1319824.1 formimidoylglutamate deiminase [Acanthopleuribacter pedis]